MTVQSEVYVIILLTVILGIAIVVIGKKVEKADPFAEPQGILKPVLLGMTTVYNSVKTNVGKATADKLTPYITVLWVYIFMSNTVSLFGLESPTANLSVTLLLAFITWVLIQVTEKFSTMCSMALRLFGNITCGGIMMQLIYAGAQLASDAIAGLLGAEGSVFNFMAPVIAPLLHAYFDLFAGFIQTLVFVTLTMVLIGNDMPDEAKQ